MATDTKKIEVEAPGARATFEKWIARGDAVGCFSNHDLGSRDVGHKIFLPLTKDEQAKVEVGRTSAPDGRSYGLGWRFVLDEVVTDLSRFEFKE